MQILVPQIPTEWLEAQGSQQFIIATLLVACCNRQGRCIKLQISAAHKANPQMSSKGLPSHARLHVAWISRLNLFIFWILLHHRKAERVSSLRPSTGSSTARVRYVTPPPLSYFLVSGWLPKSFPFRDPVGRHPTSCFFHAAAQALLCTRMATSEVTGKQCVACITQGQFLF